MRRATFVLMAILAASCGGGDDDDATAGPDATVTAPPDAAAAATWTDPVRGLFETYCWECHGAGDPLRDFSVLAMVRAEAETIRCGVAATTQAGCTGSVPARQFPIGDGPIPSDAERDLIVAWIGDGAPE